MPAVVVILFFFVILAALTGWVMNLVAIFGLWNDPVTAELVIRLIGVPIAIIGAFAGYF